MIRRRLLLLLLSLSLSPASLPAAHVHVPLVEMGLVSVTNRTVIVTGNSLPRGSSSGVVVNDRRRVALGTNNFFWISNAVEGVYLLQVLGPPALSQFRILVTNTTAVIGAQSNLVSSPYNTFPSDNVSWGAWASDLRYLLRSGLTAGSNIVILSDGPTTTIHGTGSGGGSGTVQTNISYTAVTNAPWLTNNDTRSLTLPLANSGSTNLTSTNTVLKGTTEFRTPDGNDVVTLDLINDDDNHLLSFDFSPGSSVQIGGTGVVAVAHYGAGGALTYTGSGNNGNLATTVDTVQELNDVVDNLSLAGVQNINARNILNSDGADGGGVFDSRPAIAAADAAVSATNGAFYIPPGVFRIASDLTTTNTVWFSSGARVSVDSGKTWWHRGRVIAPPQQHIFGGSGTTSFATNLVIDVVEADWFGAAASLSSNNLAAPADAGLQRALTAARIGRPEMYAALSSLPNGVWQDSWAHYPIQRPVRLRGGGFYLLTNKLAVQEVWTGMLDLNGATLYSQLPTGSEFALIECNDVRDYTIKNGTIKSYQTSNTLAAIRFNNTATVETSVTPFNNNLQNLNIYGHRGGFKFGLILGDDIDANNERFSITKCFISDYGRAGALVKNSQAFDEMFINCSFSGGGYGWFGVTAFDPTYAPNGSGSYHVVGGGGGANVISDFCANSFRQTSINWWDSESSRRLYVDPFYPVLTNGFAFDSGGTNFFGTNTGVSGFVLGNTNWVHSGAWTNDYTAHANKWVWEYLVSTGGVQRIAVTAGTRPYNPTYASEGVTSFQIVLVGNDGVTNSYSTFGSLAGNSSTRTQPIKIENVNFSSHLTPWDGTVTLLGSPRPFTINGRFRTITNHVKFGMYTSTSSGDDGSIDFHGTTFNVESAATPPPTDAERVMLFRSDGTLDTNGVNGNFVSIIGGNNIHADVPSNVTSNLLGYTMQRSVWELAGTGSKLIVGGTVISNAVASFTGNVGIGTNTPSVPLEIFKASPSANEILLRLSTSDDASRFSVDEDGDASFDGAVAVGTTITAGSSITAAGGSIIANSGRVYRSSPADGTVAWSWNSGTRIMMNTNGLLYVPGSLVISSNSWTNVITLANGENRFASSNGVPFVIAKDAAGTLTTNPIAGASGGSGNGAWRTNALTGVSQPNLSPYDPATAAIVIPQDAHFLASNGVSSRIFYPNGNAFAEFPLDSGFELNEPGGQTAIKVASGAAGGYSLIDTNNNPVLNWENGVQIPLATTTTMVVTNIVSPFGQLLSTGNATNYTIDFNTADKQSITATGNVAFLTINNISNGAMKRFYITNVFWGTSNINVLMPTNCLVVTTNSGGPVTLDTSGTNWVMTVTNSAKLSMECHAASMRGLAWYLRLLQP